jgi:hypothetical protein
METNMDIGERMANEARIFGKRLAFVLLGTLIVMALWLLHS